MNEFTGNIEDINRQLDGIIFNIDTDDSITSVKIDTIDYLIRQLTDFKVELHQREINPYTYDE